MLWTAYSLAALCGSIIRSRKESVETFFRFAIPAEAKPDRRYPAPQLGGCTGRGPGLLDPKHVRVAARSRTA